MKTLTIKVKSHGQLILSASNRWLAKNVLPTLRGNQKNYALSCMTKENINLYYYFPWLVFNYRLNIGQLSIESDHRSSDKKL